MSEDYPIDFEWAVPASSTPNERRSLEEAGASLELGEREFSPPPEQSADYAEAAFEPLMIIVGSIALVTLVRRVMTLVRDLHNDGLIIDARHDPLQIRPHPSLDRGQLLVLTPTGSQFYERGSDVPELEVLLGMVKP